MTRSGILHRGLRSLSAALIFGLTFAFASPLAQGSVVGAATASVAKDSVAAHTLSVSESAQRLGPADSPSDGRSGHELQSPSGTNPECAAMRPDVPRLAPNTASELA